MEQNRLRKLVGTLLLFFTTPLWAVTYTLPSANDALIGKMQKTYPNFGESVTRIAERYDVGFNALDNANPHINFMRGFASGTMVVVPNQHILPTANWTGIVVNLPEMRMYYFPKNSNVVATYPIGIGKIGKTIPISPAMVTRKMENPQWRPTPDIIEFNRKQGIDLPKVMGPGPDNPLGPYAIYLSLPTYLIHSTIFPESIGKRASFGCIRMYQSDIEEFFPYMAKGIPVAIINMPAKTGWQDDRMYLEVHTPLEEHSTEYEATLPGIVHKINVMTQNKPTLINWQLVSYLAKEQDGIPHEIGVKIGS